MWKVSDVMVTNGASVTSSAGIVANAHNPKREHARSLVNRRHPLIPPGEEIGRAAQVMMNNHVWVLPVAQNGKMLGLLTFQ